MRITLAHPTINRRKTFTRKQRDKALRHLAVGWRITDPDVQDIDNAFGIAEAGSESAPLEVGFDGSQDSASSSLLWDVPSGPIPDVLAWVGDDPDRAEEALDVEHAGSARTSLISQLEQIASNDTPDEGEEGSEL